MRQTMEHAWLSVDKDPINTFEGLLRCKDPRLQVRKFLVSLTAASNCSSPQELLCITLETVAHSWQIFHSLQLLGLLPVYLHKFHRWEKSKNEGK